MRKGEVWATLAECWDCHPPTQPWFSKFYISIFNYQISIMQTFLFLDVHENRSFCGSKPLLIEINYCIHSSHYICNLYGSMLSILYHRIRTVIIVGMLDLSEMAIKREDVYKCILYFLFVWRWIVLIMGFEISVSLMHNNQTASS